MTQRALKLPVNESLKNGGGASIGGASGGASIGGMIAVVSNELRITLPPNMVSANALEIVGEDLRDASAEVELAAAPPASTAAGCQFRVVDNILGKQYQFFTVNGMLFAHVDGGTDVMVPYSPTTHRWLRIRHVALTQQVVFETAPASKVWTGFRTVAAMHQVANVRVGLVAVEAGALPAPGFASFDDVVIRRPSCSSPP